MTTALDRMIAAQPDVLDALADPAHTAEAAGRLGGARRVWLVGTGSSLHAAELGAAALAAAGADARPIAASAFAATARTLLRAGDAVTVLTHTGQTAYARHSRDLARDAGAPVVSITGPDSDWPDAVRTPVAETSETYTVSYTAALAVLAQIAHHLGAEDTGPDALRETATRVRAVLAGQVDAVPIPARAMAIVGPGDWSVTAREGALKICEAARVLCEGFDPDRLLHGGAVPYTGADALLVLQPDPLTAALAEAARREMVPVTTLTEDTWTASALLTQIPMTVRLQRLALHFAGQRGQDPDVVIVGAWADGGLWRLGR